MTEPGTSTIVGELLSAALNDDYTEADRLLALLPLNILFALQDRLLPLDDRIRSVIRHARDAERGGRE